MDEEKNELMLVEEEKNKTINYISVLSVISAIAVVIMHTNGCFLTFSKEEWWKYSNIIECIFYFCVPIFFMVSGITLIDYRDRYDTKEFFKRRIKKTVIPFIFWSIISLLYFSYFKNEFEIVNLTRTQFLNAILGTQYMYVYWFFPVLFGFYLSMPLFAAIEKKLRKEVFIYLLIVCMIFNFILPFLNNVFKQNLILPITVQVGSGYLIYLIIGYLLHVTPINKITEIIIYYLGIIGLLVHIIGTYYLSMEASRIVLTYKEYINVPSILYSSAIFLLVKRLCSNIKSRSFYAIINKMKKYTYSIYLIHWILLDYITVVLRLDNHSLIYILGMPFVIIPLCIFVTYILRKIPLIRHIVPE